MLRIEDLVKLREGLEKSNCFAKTEDELREVMKSREDLRGPESI